MRPERGPDGERGFTLLEVLVALALLGVVLASLLRLAGDSVARFSSREAQLRLALAAEAAMDAELLSPGEQAPGDWPADIEIGIERHDFVAAAEAWPGLAAHADRLADDLDWLVVRATDRTGRSFTLEAVVLKAETP